ncbi:hypothetical protein [Prescottella agglutinans]|uniref:Uncharacterized protein n=1 Tax=Prescottella agglutinans TaxID=1644129 RepID=A0ABT6MLM0_9NOCA|nr:hypothetical protein [Prescottella agglutinans]MDH6284304.1 hypothetical protein [Prescottella agglutinans]
MTDRIPSPQGGILITDPPGLSFAGLDGPAPLDGPATGTAAISCAVAHEMRVRNARLAASSSACTRRTVH